MSRTTMKLEGRTALVTGGSRGIGRACALALAAAGAKVAVDYVHARSEAESVVREITTRGGRAIAVRADVSRERDVRTLTTTVEDELGAVDILVNNAGINPSKPFTELTLADWNETVAVNLTSAFVASQAVIPGMRGRRWGRLIFVSSVAAQTGGVVGPHYAASKAGLVGLMHSYAKWLATDGVTSNAVSPAMIETDMIRGNASFKPAALPVGRFGNVEEVADAILLLATTGFITGQTINVNGGSYMS